MAAGTLSTGNDTYWVDPGASINALDGDDEVGFPAGGQDFKGTVTTISGGPGADRFNLDFRQYAQYDGSALSVDISDWQSTGLIKVNDVAVLNISEFEVFAMPVPANDYLVQLSGSWETVWGAGTTTVIYPKNYADYSVEFNSGQWWVTDRSVGYSYPEGYKSDSISRLIDVREVRFQDRWFGSNGNETPMIGSSAAAQSSEPSYSIYKTATNQTSVSEGQSVSFSLVTTNVPFGTQVAYALSGISAEDLGNPGQMNGTITVGPDGTGSVSINIKADKLTEGAETLTITSNGSSASISINDSSTAPVYWLFSPVASVNEGDVLSVTFGRSDAPLGSFSWQVSGVSSDDISGAPLGGTTLAGGLSTTSRDFVIARDNLTEGPETIVISIGTYASLSVLVNDTSTAEGLTLGSSPTYSISSSSSSVNEGSTASFTVATTNLASGTSLSYSIGGISASDLTSGSLSGTTTVGSNGQATISIPVKADSLTEGPETLTVTVQGQTASVVINDTSLTPATPTYSVSSSSSSVNEGSSASFTVATTNVASGTNLSYSLYGVSSSDVTGGSLSGTTTVGSNGRATISVPIASDSLTEGSETLTVSVQGQNASVTINDTSKTPASATYSLSASASSINEGGVASFSLFTTNVSPGTSVSYSIGGISSSDIGGQSLSGAAVVDSNGRATISIPITADSLTEGTETLTVTVQNQSASVSILDTSKSVGIPTYKLVAAGSAVAEGSSAVFTLSTTNVSPGSGINYTIGGLQASDVVGGALAKSVVVGSDGTAVIEVPLASDLLTEGTETLYVTVSDQTASMTVLDTSVSLNAGNTTNNTTNNITNNNTTNITNNNTTNNTTNINSNNTSTVIDNSTKNIFKNSILNYDASVTNDSSVRQTVFGTMNLFEGSSIDNVIVGTDGVDSFAGQEGNDRFYSSKGNDTYDGGVGLDAVTFNGRVSDFELVRDGSNWVIRDLRGSDLSEGTDTLVGVERLGFGDQAVALDFETGESGYNAATLIGAAFGADKVDSYFGIGVQMFDTGSSLQQVSQLIVDLGLIESAIGSSSNSAWVRYVYRNVMGTDPDRSTERAFVDYLEKGSYTRADLLALAAGVPAVEKQVDIVGSRTKGYVYEPWDDGGGGGGGGGG